MGPWEARAQALGWHISSTAYYGELIGKYALEVLDDAPDPNGPRSPGIGLLQSPRRFWNQSPVRWTPAAAKLSRLSRVSSIMLDGMSLAPPRIRAFSPRIADSSMMMLALTAP